MKDKPSTRSYVVALLPAEALKRQVIKANQQLSTYGTEFTFGLQASPHTSIYMLQIDTKNIDTVVHRIASIAKKYNHIALKTSEYRQRRRYLAAMYVTTEEITRLQSDLIKELNPLRAETHPDSILRLNHTDLLQRRNVERYGWAMIGDAYDPHMTIARFNKDETNVIGILSSSDYFSGIFDRIALFEMGDNGVAQKKVAAFTLHLIK